MSGSPQAEEGESGIESTRWSRWAGPVLALAVLALVYGPSVSYGWRWDDYGLIARAPADRTLCQLWGSDFWQHTSTPHASGMYRPVLSSSFLVESWLAGGPSPALARGVNLLLLAGLAGLLLPLMRSWGRSGPVWLPALFLAHPVLVQTAGYVAGRSDALMMVWVSLALIGAGHLSHGQLASAGGPASGPAARAGWALITALGSFLAVGTKESALAALLLGPVLAWSSPALDRRGAGTSAAALAVGASLALTLRAAVMGGGGVPGVSLQPGEAALRYGWFLHALTIPAVHLPRYQGVALPWHELAAAFALGAGVLGLTARRAPGTAAAAAVWFVVSLVLVVELMPFGARLSESLALATWFGLCALLGPLLADTGRRALATVFAVGLLFALVTAVGVRQWSDRAALWRDAIERAPDDPLLHRQLVDALLEQGALEEAGEAVAALDALPRAGAARAQAEALYNYGNALRNVGAAGPAEAAFVAALDRSEGRLCEAAANAAMLAQARGDPGAGARLLGAVRLGPETPAACLEFGRDFLRFHGAHAEARRWDEAGHRAR